VCRVKLEFTGSTLQVTRLLVDVLDIILVKTSSPYGMALGNLFHDRHSPSSEDLGYASTPRPILTHFPHPYSHRPESPPVAADYES
jgi:hypothetical protein